MPDFSKHNDSGYALCKTIIDRVVTDHSRLLDLGCGDCPLLKYIISIYPSVKAVCVDKEECEKIEGDITYVQMDVNDYLKIAPDDSFDFVLVNAALHEFWIGNREEYLFGFLTTLSSLLRKNGVAIIGEYYYDDRTDETTLEAFRKELLATVGHADRIERFLPMNAIEEYLLETGFLVEDKVTLESSESSVRRFYVIVGRKDAA